MTRPVLIYGRFHTTSFVFMHALKYLLETYPEEFREFHFHFLLDDRRDVPLLKSMLPAERVTPHIQYFSLRPYLKGRIWPVETVDRWESLYGHPHLRTYILMERALEGKSEEVKWQFLFSHIEYFERLHQQIQPVLYISGAADGLSPWSAMAVSTARGVPVMSLSPPRFGTLSFLLDNPYELLKIQDVYQQLRRTGLSAPQRSQAETLLKGYRSRAVKPTDHLVLRAKYRLRRRFPHPLSAIRLIRESISTDAGLFDLPLSMALKRAFCARRTWFYNAWLSPKQIHGPFDGNHEKFFFFPLHTEPELSLATQGRGWVRQLELIKIISESLPIDRWLYVKEHPSMLAGIRPLRFYQRLLSFPRIRLIRQDVDSFHIVPYAEAVLTITGTAGWEALMFGRPVILFGHSFYEEFEEGVTQITDPETLPQVLREMRHRQISDEDIRAYIAAVLTKTRPGIFVEPRFYSELKNEKEKTVQSVLDPKWQQKNWADIGEVIWEQLAAIP